MLLSSLMKSGFLSNVATVLLVCDDTDRRRWIRTELVRQGLEVVDVTSAEEAEMPLTQEWIDVTIIDLQLPGNEAKSLCRRIRRDAQLFVTPVLMLATEAGEDEIVDAMRRGADDVVRGEVSGQVLTAQIKSLIRRSTAQRLACQTQANKGDVIRIGLLTVMPKRYEVYVNREPVKLTLGEYRLINRMAAHPNRVFSRQEIVQTIHDDESESTERAVDARVSLLRRKLGDAGKYIRTIRGVGYQLKPA